MDVYEEGWIIEAKYVSFHENRQRCLFLCSIAKRAISIKGEMHFRICRIANNTGFVIGQKMLSDGLATKTYPFCNEI
jgi:hypothetical protein